MPIKPLYLLSLFCLVMAPAGAETVQTVPRVDLPRYLGSWHEVARLPQFFQRHCLGDVSARYTLLDDGKIGVLNRCRTDKGFIEAKATARVLPDSGNARLKVTFFWPFSGNYWVIGLDDDYRWAVVGDPKRRYLWILSRTPVLGKEDMEKAQRVARNQGYDLGKLILTANTP